MNKLLTIAAIAATAICGCTRAVTMTSTDDFTNEVYAPRYATGFRIYSPANDTTRLMLEVYRPDTLSIIIPEGGFRSLLCMSSTYVGALSAIGADSTVVAVSNREYICNPTVKALAAEAGYDGAMDYEAILAAKPELALIYGIGGRNPAEGKLDELAIPTVYIHDFEEQQPLGRAEWIVALGALCGRDARPAFNRIADSYKPSPGETGVMMNAPYQGTWFIAGKDNYMTRLVEDGGGKICARQPEGVSSRPIDLEEALPALAKAEIWLCPGMVSTAAEARRLAPKGNFSGEIWNQTPDFYESGASRPDLVIKELNRIFTSTAPDSMRYFVRLK